MLTVIRSREDETWQCKDYATKTHGLPRGTFPMLVDGVQGEYPGETGVGLFETTDPTCPQEGDGMNVDEEKSKGRLCAVPVLTLQPRDHGLRGIRV